MMPGRKYEAQSGYRYGFNGKEKDKDLNSLTAYDYGFRIYNPGIGKFLSVDPLEKKYPYLSTYQFSSNSPIWSSDLDGLEARVRIITKGMDGKVKTDVINASDFHREKWKNEKSNYFAGFSGHLSGQKWISGLKYYNPEGKKPDDPSGYKGPDGGTLTIDATGSIINLSFEYETGSNAPKGPKPATLGESIKGGARGFNVLFIKPDPLVEGSTAFNETIKNVGQASLMVFTVGVSGTFTVGKGVQAVLQERLGKAAFDIFGQALVKQDFSKIDWSDAAAQGLFGNAAFRNAVKSLVDVTSSNGLELKSLNESLMEFGLRVVLDKSTSGIDQGAQKYTLDILRKEELQKAKAALTEGEDRVNPSGNW